MPIPEDDPIVKKILEAGGTVHEVDKHPTPQQLNEIVKAVGGEVNEVITLPDGTGAATVSYPLPKNHWLLQPHHNIPPMKLRVGTKQIMRWMIYDFPMRSGVFSKQKFADIITEATKYAYRAASMNGTSDVDPDALCQNMVVALIGYWTETGLSNDESENP